MTTAGDTDESFLARLLPRTHLAIRRLTDTPALRLTPSDVEEALGIACSRDDVKTLQRLCNGDAVGLDVLLSVMRAQLPLSRRTEAVINYNDKAVQLYSRSSTAAETRAGFAPRAHTVPALATALVHSSHGHVCTVCGAGLHCLTRRSGCLT